MSNITAATVSADRSSGAALWTGRVLTLLVVLVMLADGIAQIIQPAAIVEAMRHTGFDPASGATLAPVTLTCAILLAIPRTAVLGAILLTGFLGGAIAVHVRIGEIGSPPQIICLTLGVAAWAGLWLRDSRLRALLPFRTNE